MDKVDKLISIIRNIREEMAMTTASTAGKAGFGGNAQGFDPGPTAGYDKPLFDGRSRVARRLPPPYKSALINNKKIEKK
jgi:hypothetical protein